MHRTLSYQRMKTTTASASCPPCAGVRRAPHGGSAKGWRQRVVGVIKAVHSLIFIVNSVSVIVVFWAGVSGQRSRWTNPALAAALIESGVFVANKGRCPLTGLAENLGADSGRVSDIFLPRWLADRIPLIFGPPLAIGLVLLTWRRRCGRAQACASQFAPTLASADELARA